MTLQELSEHYQLRAQLEKDEDILYNLRSCYPIGPPAGRYAPRLRRER